MSGIVIVGASGFLGKRLAASYQGVGAVGTCHQHALPGLEFLDLRYPQQIRDTLHRLAPSVIFYAAGLTDVDACEADPDLAWRLNAEAASEAASCGSRLVYFSTDYVFDGDRGMYSEDDEPLPLNVYGRSKLAGERAVLAAAPCNLVVRLSGLYDDFGVKGQEFASPRFPATADDMRLSSPIHTGDVVSAVRLLLDTGDSGVYHVAGPDVLSRYEFWQLVALRSTGAAMMYPPSAGLAPRPRDSSLRTQRLHALGWTARRVCNGLPSYRPYGIRPVEQGQATEAILVDCVGALLTSRAWLPPDGPLEEIDRTCVAAKDGAQFWRAAAKTLDLSEEEIPALHERIAFRYAPNPPIWRSLPHWRPRYRLALVNNGPAATFRHWVRKYGLDDMFDVLANSEEMGTSKPADEFFFGVADRLGVAPKSCLLLDDDPINVEGARRSGLRAIRTIEQKSYPLSIHELESTPESEALLGLGSRRDE